MTEATVIRPYQSVPGQINWNPARVTAVIPINILRQSTLSHSHPLLIKKLRCTQDPLQEYKTHPPSTTKHKYYKQWCACTFTRTASTVEVVMCVVSSPDPSTHGGHFVCTFPDKMATTSEWVWVEDIRTVCMFVLPSSIQCKLHTYVRTYIAQHDSCTCAQNPYTVIVIVSYVCTACL